MDKFYKAAGKTLTFIFVALVLAFPATWFVMVGLGILHGRWEHIPAFGFWETYVLWVSLNFVGQGIKTGVKPAKEGS